MNALYPKAKEALLSGGLNLLTGAVKVSLVDLAAYTYSPAHQFYSSVAVAAVGPAQTLGSKTVTGGAFDAADPSFTGLTGSSIEALVIWVDTGNPNTSPLVAFLDVVAGLPFTPDGTDLQVTWSNDTSRIFAI